MSIYQLYDALQKYSAETIASAAAVVILTSFIKRKIFKNKAKKILTFVPFILGVALNVFRLWVISAMPLSEILTADTLRGGIAAGGVATVLYVFYEQFIRIKDGGISIKQLTTMGILSSVIEKDFLAATSSEIVSATEGKLTDKNYCQTVIFDLIRGKTKGGVSQSELTIISKLIITSLSVL